MEDSLGRGDQYRESPGLSSLRVLISLKKLDTIRGRPRARKLAALLSVFHDMVENRRVDNWNYWAHILSRAFLEAGSPLGLRVPDPEEAPLLSSVKPVSWRETELQRTASLLRWRLLEGLGIDAADWNLRARPDASEQKRSFPVALYLDGIRSPYNLGSIFRTAEAFGVSRLVLGPGCPDPDHPRARRTAMGSVDRVAWEILELGALAGPVFALELGGTALQDFVFPDEGTVILGSEEWGVSPAGLAQAKASAGIVTIPLYGGKSSLNVAAAAAIVLNAWTQKLADDL